MPASLHPAFLAIAAFVGIGYAIYTILCDEYGNSDEEPLRRAIEYGNGNGNCGRRRRLNLPSECTICLDPLPDIVHYRSNDVPVRTNCNHFFHIQCINRWLEENNDCPVCRRLIHRSTLTRLSQVNWFM